MSYAIIKTGGKQYRVRQGDRLRVEKLAGDVGAEISLDSVLALGGGADLKLGDGLGPVTAKILAHGRGRKIRIWKSKRRKGYEKRQGHRQSYTEIQITALPA